jgi:hypothetical protein
MENVERIEHNGKVLAIIVRKSFNKEGLTFVTGNEYGLQVGIHLQKKGFEAKPHIHIPFKELKNLEVQEMFYVERGKIRIGLYDSSDQKVADIEGRQGDILILISGNSLTCLEDSKLIEIKQGPYRGKEEKRYFG